MKPHLERETEVGRGGNIYCCIGDRVCTVTAVPARPSGKSDCRQEIYLHSKHDLRYKN